MNTLRDRFAWIAVLCAFGFVAAYGAAAQTVVGDLPRRAAMGLQLGRADVNKPESAANPPVVQTVVPGGNAEAAGIQVGDVLLSVAGVSISSSAGLIDEARRHAAGETVDIVISRKGQQLTKSVTLKPKPFETSPDAEVVYTSVSVEGSRRRVIVTKPKAAGRHPALLFIIGIGCYSVDGQLDTPGDYGPILRALAKKNFVTMRVEKTGEGDSEDPPCNDPKATASLEAEGYLAGVQLLKSYDFVDSAHVFIFAHSLGPLVNSLVLPQEQIAGFVAAETVGRSWFEFTLEGVRRRAALVGLSPEETDRAVQSQLICAEDFYTLHEPPETVARIAPQCTAMMRGFSGIPATLMQQIGDLSLGKQWKDADFPVLVTYGTSDAVMSADEGRYLADLINRWHPGRATYMEFPHMSHDFLIFDSQLDSVRGDGKPHPFDEDFVNAVMRWLEARAHA